MAKAGFLKTFRAAIYFLQNFVLRKLQSKA